MFRSRADEAAEAQQLQQFVASAIQAVPSAADVDIAAVQAVDASFEPAAFVAGAAGLFRAVRQALDAANLDAVAGRLAPELAAALGHQLYYATTMTHRLTMSEVDDLVVELRGVEATSDGAIRAVVRFHTTGRLGEIALGTDVPPATQLGQLPLRQWLEVWRLSRPAGVPTPPPASACPTCGAPASGESHCRYCQALLVDATAGFRVDAIECLG
jgi:predicted lipid-binding transport protein (Tim44 family)